MLWDAILPDTLNWEVGLQDVYRRDGTAIPGKKEVFRIDTDEHYGVVGEDYTPLQNADCAAFLQMLPDAVVEKAGMWGHGAKVWWALKLPGEIHIGSDTLHKYSIMVNAHDGSLGFRWFVTPIRPRCANMMNMLIRSAMDFNISTRHTRNIGDRVAEASRVFANVNAVYNEIAAAYTELIQTSFDTNKFKQYVASVLQPEDTEHGRFLKSFEKIQHNLVIDEYRYTKWGALNAVTEYLDHQRPMRGTEQDARRFENAVYGTTAKLKQRAYDMLLETKDGPNYLSYFSNRAKRLDVAEVASN